MKSDPANYFSQQTIQLFEDYDGFPPPPTSPTVEESIDYEDIQLTEEIGVGGFGVVHRGTYNGIDVALKEPRVGNSTVDESFINEARFWEGLTANGTPPFITNFYDWGSDPNPWICIEYLKGGTLDEFVAKHVKEHNEPLPLRIALWMGIIIACAVEYAHAQGVTHRDLKPNNILLHESDGHPVPYPKLTDWGLARVPVFTDDDDVLLTQYAAPEQLQDDHHEVADQDQGEGIDIYQVGLLVHLLLTGRHPVDSQSRMEMHQRIVHGDIPTPSERNPTLPAGIDPAIMRAIAPNRANRYQNISKFRETLENLFRSCISVRQIRQEAMNYGRTRTAKTELRSPAEPGSVGEFGKVWETQLSGRPVQTPLAIGNQLYIPLHNRVISLNLETGSRIHTFDFGLPSIDDEVIGLAARGQHLYAATKQGRLLSVQDEREIIDGAHIEGNLVASPLVIPNQDPGFVLVFNDGQAMNLYRITEKGEIEWKKQLGVGLARPLPAYQPEQELLRIVAGDSVAEVDITNGTEEFYVDCPKPVTTPVANQDKLYYGAHEDGEGKIVSINTTTQGKEWSSSLGERVNISGLAVTNEMVITTTIGTPKSHGQVLALERTEGNLSWKTSFGNASLSPPSIGSDHIHVSVFFDEEAQYNYLRNKGKVSEQTSNAQDVLSRELLPDQLPNMISINLESGQQAYRARVAGEVTIQPIPRRDFVVVVSDNGKCYGLQPS